MLSIVIGYRRRWLSLLVFFAMVLAAVASVARVETQPSSAVPRRPFARTSIWNRNVPRAATYVDVQDAIFGDPSAAPTRAGVDLITLCDTDAAAPLVSVEKSNGWSYPERAQSSGVVLYQRHLADDACTDL
jgi:hypothetical protein